MIYISTDHDLQRFFNMSRDMLCIAGFDGYFKLLSPAWRSTLGYDFEELTAKPFIEFVHADDRASTVAEVAKLSTAGVPVEFENRYYAKDGSLHRLAWSATADLDKQLIYAIARDVTAQHEAVQRLQNSLEFQRGLLHSANYSVISTDCDGVIQTFNAASERMLGYCADEMIGKQTPAIIHDVGEVARRAAELTRELGVTIAPGFDVFVEHSRRGDAEEREWTYIRKDGSRFPVMLSVTALNDPQGKAIGYLGISSDITARKNADRALRDSSARIRAILDTVVDPIITIDEHGIVESFNPAAESVFEFRAEEVIGRNVSMLMPEPYQGAHDGYMARYLTTGEQRVIGIGREVTGRSKSGATFPMELTVSEMRVTQQRMFVGVVRDITERKRLDRMKSEFVSTVSHELRTPMNAILGFTQLLSYDSNLTDKQQVNLAKVHKAGEHLLNLINDVLDLSRIEAGKITLAFEPVALSEVMIECRNLAQPLADTHNIKLHVDSGSAAGYHVRVDRARLRQVLINLITNAVKYNRAGGSVWVTCASGAPGRLRINVRDNGRGIAPDQQALLFQPFNRLGADHGEIEGTGIGLTIAKQLAGLMHGEIAFAGAPGGGSIFWVEFPQEKNTHAEPTPEPDPGEPEALRSRASTQRVLYVEDNPANLELVRALCTQFWPRVQLLSATTAEEGLELAAIQRPDLMLMDINLPGMDGYQALARLQADVNLCHIPVLAVTANAMKENIERGRAAGFTDYLTKPIDIPNFLATVDRLLLGAAQNTPAPVSRVRVLLAEDNVVNQEVARGLLEVLGYTVDVVADGRAAVEALEHARYAAVLMDCEMPVLDGYAAAAAIRNLEGNLRHTPIIAVTAHAAEEDAAQRQGAGMDDYLAKPISADMLRKVLSRWIGRDVPATTAPAPVLNTHATRQLLDLLGAHAAPIVDSLLNDLPKRLELLRVAIGRGDVTAVRHEAHTMKGSSSNLGATAFAEMCAQLSAICKSGELQRLPAAYAVLELEFRQNVTPALTQFKQALLQCGVTPRE